MKHIAQLTSRDQKACTSDASASRRPSSPAQGRPALSSRWIEALFARFALIWPTWADRIEQADIDLLSREWAEGLAGMTGPELKAAVEHCRDSCPWPPSIAEFRAAAHSGSTPEQRAFARRVAEDDAAQLALPRETWVEMRARGSAQLAALRARLAGQDARGE